ncbi:site-specific integrase [Polluticoccus soli]|uniref:site-specific integrase n=1 Tax=Polluticoccus soli TaxID=3034150 RepID=UPI0023E166E0|nr:site-specific integrase [Flavipsychrobacter sp. JY13-12]
MLSYTINFFLRTERKQADGTAPIYMRITLPEGKIALSTKQAIPPTNWNNKKQQVTGIKTASGINGILFELKSKYIQIINQLHLSKQEVTAITIQQVVNNEPVATNQTLIKVVEEHNRAFEMQIGTQYSQGSYKNYKTTLSHLQEFLKNEFNRQDIPLKQVNPRFCEQYFIWLTTVKTCTQNGGAKHLQRLKKVVNYAIKMGYLATSPISSYSVRMKPVHREALTWEEIESIRSLELQTVKLEKVRDVFIFQVFTGLAYSDVKKLAPRHLLSQQSGQVWIRMERAKTNNLFSLPLLPPAMEILMKYLDLASSADKPVFPVCSNQKMNKYLKAIQELAGISKTLHSHLSRHTFATTITLQSGVPLETVSKMLGHSKITMTQVYAKVGEIKIAADMEQLQKSLLSQNKLHN